MATQNRASSGNKSKASARNAASNGRRASGQKAKAQTQNQVKRKAEHPDEIAGVILMALGVVLGILTYTDTGAVMHAVVKVLFGLMGITAYAMPILLFGIGVALIALPNRQTGSGASALLLGAVYCINCIIHLAVSAIGEATFAEYVKDAWTLGAGLRQGGGALAAALAYAMAKLFSKGGAIVIFAAAAIVLLLLLTRASIRSAGKKVIAKVDALEDRRKARLYSEQIEDEEEAGNAAAELMEQERARHERRIRRGRQKAAQTDPGLIEETYPVVTATDEGGAADALDFLPQSGALPTAKQQADNELIGGFTPSARPEAGQHTGFDNEAFPTIEITAEDNITGEVVGGIDEPEAEHGKRRASKQKDNKPDDDNTDIEPLEGIDAPPAAVYQRPPLSLLKQPDHSERIAGESPEEKGKLLIETLASFGISARLMNTTIGPVITRFEVQPAQGVRVNKITTLSNDIALALAAPRVRIEAPIPGKAAIGIEVPNKETAMVRLREVVDTKDFSSASSPLTMALGKDIAGKPVVANLEKMPHMLIAGATGSGKSVCINGIILSLIYKASPDECRMILIDPKVVELSVFEQLPHLFCPVVTDAKKAAGVLKWAVLEMETRYKKMGKIGARDLARYNQLQSDETEKMPRLVIIIDELADLMMVSSKEVEDSICRIAQLGRACGMHLIVATQRPSVDVITGLIKTNIPSRIAFAVASATDSRVILDGGGAEKLLGRGDMLFHANGAAKPTRAQGAFVGDDEVEDIMQFFISNGTARKNDEQELPVIPELNASTGQGNGKQEDDLLPDAVRIVMDSGSASISMIQRRLRVGYARAARLVDIMEQKKIVSGFDGSKPRKVLIDEAGYAAMFGGGSGFVGAPDDIDNEDDLPFEE